MCKIISGSSSPSLAKNISDFSEYSLADVNIKKFPDGETYVKINNEIGHAIIVQNTFPDNNIIELFLIQDAVQRIADTIDIVIPYYGYGRQDKLFNKGEALSAEKMARLIEQDADRIIIVSPHKEHVTKLFSENAISCDGMPPIARYYRDKVDAVIAPDKGALEMAKNAANIIGCSFDYFEKTRISGNEVRMKVKNMDVDDKKILILDDIISTGGTMQKAVQILSTQNANKIYVACIHGLFIGDSAKKIFDAGCTELVSTDTIESRYSKVSVAEEIASIIR